MITFSVSRLEKENIRLEGAEPPYFIVLAGSEPYSVASPVEYDLEISRASGGALVSGCCGVEISGECGRCLTKVSRRVSTEDFRIFVEIPPGVEVCDISEDIRTEITLALPMNFLCRDDCRGLCPVCGADRNRVKCSCHVDNGGTPGVWDALDGLKF